MIRAVALAAIVSCLSPVWGRPQPPSPGAKTGPYEGFGYPWENNTLGIDRRVPEPWTPVRIDGRSVGVWGRTFRYGNGVLPEQIVTQGRQLFASPPVITLSVDGRTRDLDESRSRISGDSQPDCATVLFDAGDGDLRVTAVSTLEFDGFLRIDLALSPKSGSARMDSLIIDLPLRRAAARYFSHDYGYDFETQLPAGRDSILHTAGAIGERIARPFHHHFWVGSDFGGIELEWPTNLEWSPRVPDEAIELLPQDETVILRLNIVTEPRLIDAETRFEFAFYVTPTKPMPKDWRARIVSNNLRAVGDESSGARVIETFDQRLWEFHTFRPGPTGALELERFGMPGPPVEAERLEKYDRTVTGWRESGIRIAPYAALMALDAGIPELREYAPYWLFNPHYRRRLTSPEETALGSEGHVPITLYSKSIQDFMVWTHVQSAREWGYDGLYFDLADPRLSNFNPNASDVDVRALPGKVYSPIFETREFRKRLYKAVKAVRTDFQIAHHHGKGTCFHTAFADVEFTGEGLNAVFRRVVPGSGAQPEPGMTSYTPDYARIPEDYYMAVYGPPSDRVQILIPQIVTDSLASGRADAQPRDDVRYSRTMLSRSLILDLIPVRIRMDFPTYDRVMLAFEMLGGLKEPLRVFRLGQMDRIVRNLSQSRLKVVAYARPEIGRALLVVANWSAQPVRETLELNVGALGLEAAHIERVSDCEGREPPHTDGIRLNVLVPDNDFRMLLLE